MCCIFVGVLDKFHSILLAVSSDQCIFAATRGSMQDQKTTASMTLNKLDELLNFLFVDDKFVNCLWRMLLCP